VRLVVAVCGSSQAPEELSGGCLRRFVDRYMRPLASLHTVRQKWITHTSMQEIWSFDNRSPLAHKVVAMGAKQRQKECWSIDPRAI
jgi:hypothetical protein